MIPNLNHLSLHDVANTMGFYEPTEEEQASMNDDPVTLEKPLHTMTFRVRLADDGLNGEPRYKYFSPAELWRWVKDHDTLPSREGPIWYEDWWALCNTYNPDHHDVPAWAHRLKHRSEYVAERARERAAQAQQAARANARAEREGEGEPRAEAPAPPALPPATTRLPPLRRGEERLGPQRATDQLIQWHFWLKPADSAAENRLDFLHVNDRVRGTFETYMLTHFISPQAVARWRQRLEVETTLSDAIFVGDNDPAEDVPVLLVTCNLWLPQIAWRGFLQFFITEKRKYGMGTTIRRWLGIIGAERGAPDADMTPTSHGQWNYLQDHPNARPSVPGPFTMTRDGYYTGWRNYLLEDDPLPIIRARKGPQSPTDVPIEWRLWVKGRFREPTGTGVARHVRAFLSRWFHNQGVFQGDPIASLLDISQRLSISNSHGRRLRNAVPDSDSASPVSHIDFQLYLPTMELAETFVDACIQYGMDAEEESFATMMRNIVGVTGARAQVAEDFPTIRRGPLRMSRRVGLFAYERMPGPIMTRQEYEEWASHTLLDLPPVIEGARAGPSEPGPSEPGPSEPGPSSSAAFREQARRERLDEAQRAGGEQPSLGQRLFGSIVDADPDEDEEMEEVVLDEGTVGPPPPSSSRYEPTSPTYSPTSPSYDPTAPPPTIDPMTPDRAGGESSGAQRAYRAMDPNDPEYAVTIRWRFWLKGSMDSRQVLDAEEAMRSNFGAYMANNSDLSAGNNGFPWYHRLRVEIFERREYDWTSQIRFVDTVADGPLLRCEVSLKVSEATAYRFASWSMNDRTRRSSWANQAVAWHNYGPAQALEASDFPRVVDSMTQYPSPPMMRHDQFTDWLTWAVLPE